MRINFMTTLQVLLVSLPLTVSCAPIRAGESDSSSQIAVIFSGGHETNPVDHGRPVVLVAGALGVPSEVFRQAFSAVKPASGAQEPEPDQVRKNKGELMRVLQPLGITNDRLDEVSNYYRYNGSKGQMWKTAPASATASVRNGVVTGFTIVNPGAGYSSPPKISVIGAQDFNATATLAFGTDFDKNGSIKEIKLVAGNGSSAGTPGATPRTEGPRRPNRADTPPPPHDSDGPPRPEDRDAKGDGPPPPPFPPPPHGPGGPGGPGPVGRALRAMQFGDDQKSKADPIMKKYHDDMKAVMDKFRDDRKKLQDALTSDLKGVLDPKQMDQLKDAIQHSEPPHPPPPHAQEDGPPPPPPGDGPPPPNDAPPRGPERKQN